MNPPTADRRTDRLKLAGAAAILFAAAFLAYLPSLRGAEMWNDSDYLTTPQLASLHGLWRIWFEVGATQQYYPLLHTAFWIEHRLWGGSMLGYHLINVAWHATVACLFGLLLRRLAVPGAFLAALVVAVHPIFVESVAWITEQKNTLSGVFFFCSALAYFTWEDKARHSRDQGAYRSPLGDPSSLRFAAAGERDPELRRRATQPVRGAPVWYFLALFLYVCAVLSKTVTAPLPAALLVVIWWRRGGRSWRRDVLPLVPWFVAGAAGGLFSAWVERTYIGASGKGFDLGFGQRILVAGRVVWFYAAKLVWPARLDFNYPRWHVSTSEAWQFVFPLAAIALLAVLWRLGRRNRAPLAAVLLFGGLLFPVLGFFNVYAFVYSFVADHFAYLAVLPIIALGAAGWELAGRRHARWRKALKAAAVVVLLVFGSLSWAQAHAYTDRETFYRAILARNPQSWMADNNLGDVLLAEGRSQESIPYYEAALRLNPDAKAHYNLGMPLAQTGKFQRAISEFDQAIALDPGFVSAHYNRGLTYAMLGKYPEAIADYRAAMRGDPTLAQVHSSLGYALICMGDLPGGTEECRKAVEIGPNLPDGRFILGFALAAAHRYPEAVEQYRAAERIDPTFPETHNYLGVALAAEGRLQEAAAEFQMALRLQPHYDEAKRNLDAIINR